MCDDFELADEYVNWRDNGCDLHVSCLTCPLPRCIEEEPHGRQRIRMTERAEAMVALKREGNTAAGIARIFGISVRSVQRELKKYAENNCPSLGKGQGCKPF